MTLQELFKAIENWAEARNLIKGSDAKTQTLKTVSEFGEIGNGLVSGNADEIEDGIGDTIVTMVIACRIMGTDLSRALPALVTSKPVVGDASDVYAAAASLLGFMCDNVIKGQAGAYIDHATDLLAFLAAIGDTVGLSLASCTQTAYDSIKDRRGVMYHGAFIKSTDERYASACAELGLAAEV